MQPETRKQQQNKSKQEIWGICRFFLQCSCIPPGTCQMYWTYNFHGLDKTGKDSTGADKELQSKIDLEGARKVGKGGIMPHKPASPI